MSFKAIVWMVYAVRDKNNQCVGCEYIHGTTLSLLLVEDFFFRYLKNV